VDQEDYVSSLENVIKQMLKPIKNIPFKLVIESISGNTVFPYDRSNSIHSNALENLKRAIIDAGNKINVEGIKSKRPNEAGNKIEPFVKEALNDLNLIADVPTTANGKKKATGYPDLIFNYNGHPFYLECKTYNIDNINTTQRSFYFSPSNEHKIIHDAVHFMVSYELYVASIDGAYNIYKTRHFKILSLENLSIDVKYEFNSDNKRMYSEGSGAKILIDEDI